MKSILKEKQGVRPSIIITSQGRGKIYVHSTLPRPHLWDYTGYVVVVVVHL
uniref:Uncharacterized protein n=1 Tax=Solanum tuberosum TaxID=4113 RepID=M1C767_SOLTU